MDTAKGGMLERLKDLLQMNHASIFLSILDDRINSLGTSTH